jgi:hypothetical protein
VRAVREGSPSALRRRHGDAARLALLLLAPLLVTACASDGASPGSGDGAASRECAPASCGPALGMPNVICPDGSTGGPTGRCLEDRGGRCGWEIRDCPSLARCGAGVGCSGGLVCVDRSGDACTYPADAGCDGACVVPTFCGGIAAIPCPGGRACVDDPRDDCAPPRGADCGGLCAP